MVLYMRIPLGTAVQYYPTPQASALIRDQRRRQYESAFKMLTWSAAVEQYPDLATSQNTCIKPGQGTFFKPWVQLLVNKLEPHVLAQPPNEVLRAVQYEFDAILVRFDSNVFQAVSHIAEKFDSNPQRETTLLSTCRDFAIQNQLVIGARIGCLPAPPSPFECDRFTSRDLFCYVQVFVGMCNDGFLFKIGYVYPKNQRPNFEGSQARLDQQQVSAGWITLCEIRNGVINVAQKESLFHAAQNCGVDFMSKQLQKPNQKTHSATTTFSRDLIPGDSENMWMEFAAHVILAPHHVSRFKIPWNTCREVFIVQSEEPIFNMIAYMNHHFHAEIHMNPDIARFRTSFSPNHPMFRLVARLPRVERAFYVGEDTDAPSHEPDAKRHRVVVGSIKTTVLKPLL